MEKGWFRNLSQNEENIVNHSSALLDDFRQWQVNKLSIGSTDSPDFYNYKFNISLFMNKLHFGLNDEDKKNYRK
jgi:hypothetical protein